MRKNKPFALVLLMIVIPVFGFPRDKPLVKSPSRVPTVTGKVKVDGMLNEKVWQEALVMELNYEVEPGENITPPVKTEVLLASSQNHFYVAFRAYDPEPSGIRARITDRDNIWEDDYVGIVLDTFNDSRRTFNFYCNPLGVQADQIGTMMEEMDQWDGIWNSAGKIDEKGYVVEIDIPFSSLRFQRARDQQTWGIDAIRSYPRSLSHLIGLFPRDRNNNCYMCQAEKVIGFGGAKPGKNLEFDPTLSALVTQERENGTFHDKTKKIDPGLTFRWSFTPNLTLSTAINPDFSQVEADTAQLDINLQFALLYPEKRPFFLEGSGIFDTRLYAVYTRTIADPDWGVKVTGKEGSQVIGFYSVRDNITNLIFPGSQGSRSTSLDLSNLSTVLRYRRDIGPASTVGVLITDREGKDYYNRLAAVDGDLRFAKKNRILFQLIGTQTRYPDEVSAEYDQPTGKFTGTAFDILYSYSTRNVLLYGTYQDIKPDFRADLGFIEQVDDILGQVGAKYTWRRNPGHWYTQLTLGAAYFHKKDHDHNLLRKGVQPQLEYYGPLQSYLKLVRSEGKKAYLGREFDDCYWNLNAEIRPWGDLLLGLQGNWGDSVDFTNVRPGKRLRIDPFIQYNIGRHLYAELDHLFERLNVDGGRLYTANVSNIRLVYQFNRRTFLRTILQYVYYKYHPELYSVPVDPQFKHLFTQVLFSYKVNPQTVILLGYSDDYYGDSEIPLTQNNRTFFLKVGYALVL